MQTRINKAGTSLMQRRISRTAAREYILEGNPITEVESCMLFGCPSVHKIIGDLRKKGYVIKSDYVSYSTVKKRINNFFKMDHPINLPINNISFLQHQRADINTAYIDRIASNL